MKLQQDERNDCGTRQKNGFEKLQEHMVNLYGNRVRFKGPVKVEARKHVRLRYEKDREVRRACDGRGANGEKHTLRGWELQHWPSVQYGTSARYTSSPGNLCDLDWHT